MAIQQESKKGEQDETFTPDASWDKAAMILSARVGQAHARANVDVPPSYHGPIGCSATTISSEGLLTGGCDAERFN